MPDTPPMTAVITDTVTVVTPAGRLPADHVFHVKPGQTIRRNDDGTMSVIDKVKTGSQPPTPKDRDLHEQPRPHPGRV